MKVNLRGLFGRHNRSFSCLAGIFITMFLLLTLLPTANAHMTKMTDSELSEITGEGFSRFSLSNGVALAEFNIRASTYTEIDSMKLGHYDNGSSLGWDQDWTGLTMGSQSSDLLLQGFYFQAVFDNINDPATRKLDRITIGWRHVTGTITADFSSYSGYLQGTTYSRGNLGTKTITLNNEPMSLTIDVDKGIEVSMGN